MLGRAASHSRLGRGRASYALPSNTGDYYCVIMNELIPLKTVQYHILKPCSVAIDYIFICFLMQDCSE